jgi:uncharacterized membrane protein YsdA (DUF1294 family)
MSVAALVALWLAIINALTVLAFWADKRIAQEGGWRISEFNLLVLAFIGGSPGAMFARHRFRHKTRKQPFSSQLIVICLVQLAGLIALALSRS